jgi:NCAIR mutase (PurE)-related protein
VTRDGLLQLLEKVAGGALAPREAAHELASGPFRESELGFATLDHHRAIRHPIGEVIYGESKTLEQVVAIAARFAESGAPVLATRLDSAKIASLRERFSNGRANEAARTFIVNPPPARARAKGEPFVAVLAAGTSDLPVAEEACEVCAAAGVPFERIYDVGVSGLHRLLGKLELVRDAAALVVAAGMEGALPSVVAGLVSKPLFAVPTGVGYGASFGGVAALLAMLNSCAPGVTVVNIDNGFSAGFAACNVALGVREALAARVEKS